ncbi:MAG: hypothetical protein J6386_02925 [Candidatus Synoicihabitans palmerolidicus]|nr:hypothetical protein [Candidatus Synoicihabitans palmerolidicus]
MIHLEDNETELLAQHLNCRPEDFCRFSAEQFNTKVPPFLSHPRRAQTFLCKASGLTTIIDRLAEFVPSGTPTRTIWPAANAAFSPRPPPIPISATNSEFPSTTP